jgi:hypothetical protein
MYRMSKGLGLKIIKLIIPETCVPVTKIRDIITIYINITQNGTAFKANRAATPSTNH